MSEMVERDDKRRHFTLVFAGDLKDFPRNPFQVDTPFGRPVGVALGDLFAERDRLEEQLRDAALSEPS